LVAAVPLVPNGGFLIGLSFWNASGSSAPVDDLDALFTANVSMAITDFSFPNSSTSLSTFFVLTRPNVTSFEAAYGPAATNDPNSTTTTLNFLTPRKELVLSVPPGFVLSNGTKSPNVSNILFDCVSILATSVGSKKQYGIQVAGQAHTEDPPPSRDSYAAVLQPPKSSHLLLILGPVIGGVLLLLVIAAVVIIFAFRNLLPNSFKSHKEANELTYRLMNK